MAEPADKPQGLDGETRDTLFALIHGELDKAVKDALARGASPEAVNNYLDERIAALREQNEQL